MRGLSIGQLARSAQVTPDTIRFYEKCGLMPPPARRPSGFREYTREDLEQLVFIRRARAIGFTIEEIVELLNMASGPSNDQLGAVIAKTRAAMEARISELTSWRTALDSLLALDARRATRQTIVKVLCPDSTTVTARRSTR